VVTQENRFDHVIAQFHVLDTILNGFVIELILLNIGKKQLIAHAVKTQTL
jgi:hypothetical protein